MKRREFIALLGGAAAWPLTVHTQQPAGQSKIGLLGSTTAQIEGKRVSGFVQRLREFGWIDGKNVIIEYRWTDGRTERFAEIAAEFVKLRVDVIVT